MKLKGLSNLTIKELRAICQPPSSRGYLPMNIFRKGSIYLTALFLYLNITPTTITFVRFFIGLIGISLIGFGSYGYLIAGIIVYHFAFFLDLNDGEMFRYNSWKTGKKESILRGSFLDKVFDQVYRPLLLLAAGIGALIQFGNPLYLYFSIAGAVLVSIDPLIKLRTFEAIIYKQQTEYLKEQKQRVEADSGRLDWVFELFRINNPMTLYFWFGIFGILRFFVVFYTPLLFLLVVRTFFVQYKRINELDKEILAKMYKTKSKKSK